MKSEAKVSNFVQWIQMKIMGLFRHGSIIIKFPLDSLINYFAKNIFIPGVEKQSSLKNLEKHCLDEESYILFKATFLLSSAFIVKRTYISKKEKKINYEKL